MTRAGYRSARRVLARLLAAHTLKAADAFQVAAAVAWCGGRVPGHGIVTLDSRLHDAVSREGFDPLANAD